MPGEFEFIEWIKSQHKPSQRLILPPGDDLAVLSWEGEKLLLVGVDQVLDGVHFDASIHSPQQIGAKVINRNLSDCAAMACLPVAAVVSATLPGGIGLEYARQLYLGIKAAAAAFDCDIAGGDTASWPGKLVLSVTILGRAAGIPPLTRSGARPGDHLYVSGPLGGSILGRHLCFTPRIHLARELAGRGDISAMIDLSDGLSRDLAHICRASGVGAIVEADRVPIHADAHRLAQQDGRPPLLHALHDGEDYELLYSSPNPIPGDIRIGAIVEGDGIRLQHPDGRLVPLDPRGWEHPL